MTNAMRATPSCSILDVLLRELMTTGWPARRLSKARIQRGNASCTVPQDVCSPSGVPDASEYEQRPASAAGISAHYPGRRGSHADGSGDDAKAESGQLDREVLPHRLVARWHRVVGCSCAGDAATSMTP